MKPYLSGHGGQTEYERNRGSLSLFPLNPLVRRQPMQGWGFLVCELSEMSSMPITGAYIDSEKYITSAKGPNAWASFESHSWLIELLVFAPGKLTWSE